MMEGADELTIEKCPFCSNEPNAIAVSIRGQIFCRCGAEIRTNIDPETGLVQRIVLLIKKWNARAGSEGKATVCMKEVEPCPCCGSVKISLLSDHSGLECKCGLRLKPSSNKLLSVADLITIWNTRGQYDD